MKISKSKQELARIINENGGWRGGSRFYVSSRNGAVLRCENKPSYSTEKRWISDTGLLRQAELESPLPNWHQTILSRAEYFHLYPAPDAEPRLCESVMRSIQEPTAKPTIEQLAADYRNAKDYADRKQQEADDAKADADERLKALEIAGEAIGLLLSPINAKKEPELVIAVQVGDEVECIESNVNPNKYKGIIGTALEVDDSSTPYLVDFGGKTKIWCHEVKFIRRP